MPSHNTPSRPVRSVPCRAALLELLNRLGESTADGARHRPTAARAQHGRSEPEAPRPAPEEANYTKEQVEEVRRSVQDGGRRWWALERSVIERVQPDRNAEKAGFLGSKCKVSRQDRILLFSPEFSLNVLNE